MVTLTTEQLKELNSGASLEEIISDIHTRGIKEGFWYKLEWDDGDIDVVLADKLEEYGFTTKRECFFRNGEVLKEATGEAQFSILDDRYSLSEASNEVVQELLFKEIERLGLTEGTKYKSLRTDIGRVRGKKLNFAPVAWGENYTPKDNGVFCTNNGWLFHQGEFAKPIVEEKPEFQEGWYLATIGDLEYEAYITEVNISAKYSSKAWRCLKSTDKEVFLANGSFNSIIRPLTDKEISELLTNHLFSQE